MNCLIRNVGFAAVTGDGRFSTNHTTRLRFADMNRVLEIANRNLDDLEAILSLMEPLPLRLFRLGSSLVPFASHLDLRHAWQPPLAPRLGRIGLKYQALGFRFSMHPGQYITLATPDEDVLQRSRSELAYATETLDLMGLDRSHKVVLHGGSLYGDRTSTTERLIDRVGHLASNVRSRLVLENDERYFNLEEILDVAERSGVPVVFDIHHHNLNPSPTPLDVLLPRVSATWDSRPKMHISSQREGARPGAHADYIRREDVEALCRILPFEVDLMVEAKAKELAAIQVAEWLRN